MTYLLVCPFLLIFLNLNLQPTQVQGISFHDLRLQHTPKTLSGDEVEYLAKLSNVNYTEQVLDSILIPREVGTTSHEHVYYYIVKELKKLNWHVDIDKFEKTNTSLGTLTFKNIVGTLNPNAERYLVLACHYDSEYSTTTSFLLGATDSAVPCAMMLNLIDVLKDRLAKIRNNNELNLKLIFFDGERTILNKTDGYYGVSHFAQKYSENRTFANSTNDLITDLDKFDLYVLLDMLGAPDPTFYSYFNTTEKWYARLLYAEECLKDLKQLKGSAKRGNKRYFEPRSLDLGNQTHMNPSLLKGVPSLHLMPYPPPKTWGTAADRRESLDPDTIEDLNKILRVFVTEYLHLSVNII